MDYRHHAPWMVMCRSRMRLNRQVLSFIVPTLCVGMQPLPLQRFDTSDAGASPEAFPRRAWERYNSLVSIRSPKVNRRARENPSKCGMIQASRVWQSSTAFGISFCFSAIVKLISEKKSRRGYAPTKKKSKSQSSKEPKHKEQSSKIPGEPKAEVAVGSIVPVTVARTQVLREVEPRAAPNHPAINGIIIAY